MMKAARIIGISTALLSLLLGACAPVAPVPTATPTVVPSPTPRPEKNVALKKPVRVSASWVVDPPERAVDGNTGNWWGAGGPIPQWIEVDLGGLYSVSRIRILNQGPTGEGTYRVLGRRTNNANRLLHEFPGRKFENQSLEFRPDEPWEDISTLRVEIVGGYGWVGLREVEAYSRDEPEPLEAAAPSAPRFLAGVKADALQPITADNAVLLQHVATFGRGTINELSWSPDGRTLAAAGSLGVWLYDAASLDAAPLLLEGHSRETLTAAFSSDSKLLYSASQDGTVKTWNVATGEARDTSALWNDFSSEVGEQKRSNEVWASAFNPDRTMLAAGALDGTLRLWDLHADRPVASVAGHQAEVSDIAFSPDGTLLATSDYKGSTFIRTADSGSVRVLVANLARVLAFSPDSQVLATGGSDGAIRLWDAASGRPLSMLKGHAGPVIAMAFSPDGTLLASNAADKTLRFWDVKSASERGDPGELLMATSLAFSPDGERLATYSSWGLMEIWEVETGKAIDHLLLHTSAVTSIAFSPDDSILAAGDEDGFLRIWNVRANKLDGFLLTRGGVTGIAFSPDGSLVAASARDARVAVWNVHTGEAVAALEGHKSYVRCVAFSPDGKLIASGSTDKTIRLWDTSTWKEAAVLEGHTSEVESVAFSPDGAWLVSTSADKTVRAWNVAHAEPAGILGRHDSFALSGVFSPDGSQVASGGGDHSLRMWSVQEALTGGLAGTARFPAIGHGGWVLATAFSPDGSLVASSNVSTTSYYVAPGEIHLYSAQSGFPYALLRGHTKRVTGIAFSADGRLLASGSADGSVRIWGTDKYVPPSVKPAATAAPSALPPTATPQPILPSSGNLALNQPVTASRGERQRPAERAFDGDLRTDWGSGNFPPQWIQVDLGTPASITQVRLLVTQHPVGRTVHRILAGGSEGTLTEVHRFAGNTQSGDWLEVRFAEPLQNIEFVRIETLESPSWVGWVEIEVTGVR